MKRNIFTMLVLVLTLTAKGQAAGDRINLWLETDNTNSSSLQIGINIDNKSDEASAGWGWDSTIYLCAVSLDLDLPEGLIMSTVTGGDMMRNGGHSLFYCNYEDESRYPNRWFICCIPKYEEGHSAVFSPISGRLCTLNMPTFLSEGIYDIIVRNVEFVSTDGYKVYSYTPVPDFSYQFKIQDGIAQPPVPTEIKGVEDKDYSPVVAGPQGIYTLQGVKVEKTQPGNIYIINGKKVVK